MSKLPKKPDLSNECEAHQYTCELLDDIASSQRRIEEVQLRQEIDIKHHIARTDELQTITVSLSQAVKALEATRNQLFGGVKLLFSLGALLGLLKLIFTFLGK